MVGTIKVGKLQAADGTGNTISLESGHTLDASQGLTTPAGHVIQTTSMVSVNDTQISISNSSTNTLVGNGVICAITPVKANSKIRVCLVYPAYTPSGTYLAVFMGRSVAGGTYDYCNSGKVSNFTGGGDWSNQVIDIIDTQSYTLGQALSYQPYFYTTNTSTSGNMGWGSSGSITFYCQELAG